MNEIYLEFGIGEIVYYKLDPEQNQMFISSIRLMPGNVALYECSSFNGVRDFYGFELTREADLLKRLEIQKRDN